MGHHDPAPLHPITLNFIKDNYTVHQGIVYRIKDAYIGSINGDGYRQFKILVDNGRMTVLSHHIAWFFYRESWPTQQIDHKDRDKLNNLEDNIRYTNSSNNLINKNKKSDLPPGVKLKKSGYYEAYINYNGSKMYICSCKTAEEAGARFVEMHRYLFGVTSIFDNIGETGGNEKES